MTHDVLGRLRRPWVWAVAAAAALGLQGCSRQTLSSSWLDREIAIDGRVQDWGDARAPMEREDLIWGVRNDADHLYLTLTPRTRSLQRQMMFLGFTIWFDPAGGKEKTLGVRCPLGMMGFDPPPLSAADDWDTSIAKERFRGTLHEIELLKDGGAEARRLRRTDAEGLRVHVDLVGDVLVYELCVALHAPGAPLDLGLAPGALVGVGFETPALDRRALMEAMREGARPPAGSRGRPPAGGAMRGGDRGGSGPSGGGPGVPERLDAWVALRLAAAPPSTDPPAPQARTGTES